MAARTRRGTKDQGWADVVRERIGSSMIANRLRDHALGKVEMTSTQVQAGLGLLRKTLPDLQATELSGQVAHPTVIRAPDQPASSKAWLEQHGPQQLDAELPKPGEIN